MGSRFPSHQLSNGLYVSGSLSSQKKEHLRWAHGHALYWKSGQLTSAPSRTGSFGGAASHSGPIMPNAAARA
ncbi:hypothetical protein L3X38_015733 [Prunus dulcis]|uniref:Uncharacterized protein n=1 Tax=Prunus dulcis TaxID=3755 RepID=A0AAD4W6H8_PRUDU|nr:hypothetical protein L3X38_015733 [Prunus dulcis]